MSRPKMWGEHIADGWYEVLDAETLELLQARKPWSKAIPVPGRYPEGDYMRSLDVETDGSVTQAVSRGDGNDNPIPRAVFLRVAAACALLPERAPCNCETVTDSHHGDCASNEPIR